MKINEEEKDETIGEVIVSLNGEEVYNDYVYVKKETKKSFWDFLKGLFS